MKCSVCGHDLAEKSAYCVGCGAPVPEAEEVTDFLYEAFISYRHDPADRSLAMRIQRYIEGYRIPGELGKGRAGRLGKCFRDEDELPTSDSLPDLIEHALRRSRFLIVVCSPRMRESLWVAREVELFSTYHGRDHILLALLEGEPKEAFPPLLMTISKREGDVVRQLEAEPIAADMRRSSKKRFSDEVLRIVAPIVGCGYDDLRQRARSRHLRRVAAAACASTVVGAAFGGFALFQRAQIQANYEDALINQSEYLAEEATTLLEQGDRMQAVQVALHALGQDGSGERPYVPSARLALEEACQVYPDRYWRPCYSNFEEREISEVSVSDDGSMYAVMTSDGVIHVYDATTGTGISEISLPTITEPNGSEGVGTRMAASFSGNVIVGLESGDACCLACYDPKSGEALYRQPLELIDSGSSLEMYGVGLFVSQGAGVIAVVGEDLLSDSIVVTFIDSQSGRVLLQDVGGVEHPVGMDGEPQVLGGWEVASFSDDGDFFALASGRGVVLYDIPEQRRAYIEVGKKVSSLAITSEVVFVGSVSEGESAGHATIAAYDLSEVRCLWAHEEETSRRSTEGDVDAPLLFEMVDAGAPGLLAAIGSKMYLFSPLTGDIVFTLFSEDLIELAHFFPSEDANFGIAYAGGGTLRTVSNLAPDYEGAPPFDPVTSSAFTIGDNPDVGETARVFFTGAEGEKLCLLTLGRPSDIQRSRSGTLLYRYDRYNTCPNREDAGQGATDLATGFESRSVGGRFYVTHDHESDSILIFDGATFERLDSIELSVISKDIAPDAVPVLFFSPENDETLYVVADAADGNASYLCSIDVGIGEVQGVTKIAGTMRGEGCFEIRNGLIRYLVPEAEGGASADLLISADSRTLEVMSVTRLESQEGGLSGQYRSEICSVGSMLLVSDGGVRAYHLETGSSLDCDVTKLTLNSSRSECMTVDSDHSRVLIFAEDELCVFDAQGNRFWSIPAANADYSDAYVLFAPSGDVFLREESGQCSLIDGERGAVLATAKETVGSPSSVWMSSDGARLYARDEDGLAVINLGRESFGVESRIPLARVVSADESRVLCYDSRGVYTLPLYTVDELAAYARQLVEGHELAESEERLYHLG